MTTPIRCLLVACALAALVDGAALAGDAAAPAAAPTGGVVRGRVKIPAGGDASTVFVYLKGTGLSRTVPREPKLIRQRNKQFSPRVVAVVRGTTIDFPNDDRIMHNVYSRTPGSLFDLGHYKKGASKAVTFTKTGPVDIYCNIHPQMVATVLVVDNDFYTPVAADGAFELRDVPAGKYEVAAWMPFSAVTTRPVEVKAGAVAAITLEVAAPNRKQEHLNKDNMPYGRYK